MNSNIHLQTLEEIRPEIADLEKRLAELRAVERYHARKAGVTETSVLATTSKNGTATTKVAKLTLSDAAALVLRRSAGKLSTREIADGVLAVGYVSKNPDGLRNNTFSTLNREKDKFKKVGAGIWSLVDPEKER